MKNTFWPILLYALGALYMTVDVSSVTFRCYNGSFTNYSEFSLDDPTFLINSSCFDYTKKTVIYTFGFGGKANGGSVRAIVDAYLSVIYNVVLVNWENEASISILGNFAYPIIAMNAIKIGKRVGRAIILLVKAGIPLGTFRLIGFSLGAHLMGYAAREVQTTGQNISLIIGLDPAGPLFTGVIGFQGLDASCGDFVLIVHTNPGRLGIDESIGNVDVWFNCGNPVQPGCEDAGTSLTLISPEDMCSHNRSWEVHADWVNPQRQGAYIARYARSCEEWKAGNGGSLTITLTLNIDTKSRGNYYLNTESQPVYGKGDAGSNPN